MNQEEFEDRTGLKLQYISHSITTFSTENINACIRIWLKFKEESFDENFVRFEEQLKQNQLQEDKEWG